MTESEAALYLREYARALSVCAARAPAEDDVALLVARRGDFPDGVEGVEGDKPVVTAGAKTGDLFLHGVIERNGKPVDAYTLNAILGSDTAAGLPTWDRVDDVRDRATVVVVGRAGVEKQYDAFLRGYPGYKKAGFGLRIDDLPDHYRLKQEVIVWESRFWRRIVAPSGRAGDANLDLR